jgi:hypothetical protein
MDTKQLDDNCNALLAWMVTIPDEYVHFEDAAQKLGRSKGEWLTVFEHLIKRGLAESSGKYNTVIELTPQGVDIANQNGGYLAYVTQERHEKEAEIRRSKRTSIDSRTSVIVAGLTLLATVIIAIVQYRQNAVSSEKIELLEARQKSMTDSLKRLYKEKNKRMLRVMPAADKQIVPTKK